MQSESLHSERKRQSPPAFRGRRLVVATMHGKEAVITPRLEQRLGVVGQLTTGLNTDQFGTFSGEVPRMGSPLDAARQKIRAALRQSNATLAVASEGSFGPHPHFPFVAANVELLLFYDAEADFEVQAEVISTKTNFASRAISHADELTAFAESALFPSHGLLFKPSSGEWVKGIHDWQTLRRLAEEAWRRAESFTLETDMRAMHNPTRMQVIADCTDALIEKLESVCPSCAWPGFWVTERRPGLPCGQCGLPTRLTRMVVYACGHCGHADEKPAGEKFADPMYCDFCNP